MRQMSPVFLVLDDGTVFRGTGFGAPPLRADELSPGAADMRSAGEVVFNTAMSGYHEVLTDPSYTGQLVVMTYPHIGNYGALSAWSEADAQAVDAAGETALRDERPIHLHAAGFILRDVYRGPVPDGRITLNELLEHGRVPGISGVDTRRLTLKLRNEGSRTGVLLAPREPRARELSDEELSITREYLRAFPDMVGRNLVTDSGVKQQVSINGDGAPHIVLIDCGSKANIVRELTKRGCRITILPNSATPSDIESVGGDAVLVSNGPGDPAVLEPQIESLRSLVGTVPLFGICLGHQLLSHALGAETEKMKFGHHGVNHPVRDELSGRVFVTSQNHGFTVREDSLPEHTQVWFRNANDGSIEGIVSEGKRVYTAQFHPESAPGPSDSSWIFDAFLSHIEAQEFTDAESTRH